MRIAWLMVVLLGACKGKAADADADADADTDTDTDTDADADAEPPPCASAVSSTVPSSPTGVPVSTDIWEPSCACCGSNDVAIAFTAPADGTYVFDSLPADLAIPVLSVADSCDGPELGCDRSSSDPRAQVVLPMVAGQTVVVFLEDYYGFVQRPLTINIAALEAAESDCFDDRDLDADGAVDCSDSDCAEVPGCTEVSCTDGVDDEGDGAVDCMDADCAADPGCVIVCPFDVMPAGLPSIVTGSTVGRPDSGLPPLCGSGDSSDVSYEFTAPADGTYTFDTDGSSFDTVLYALDTCGGSDLACNDDAVGYYGYQSEIELTLVAGESIVLVVDGDDGASGRFTLTAQ